MPARARTRGVRQGLVVFAVAWSFHERTPYVDGRTLLSWHGGDYWLGSPVRVGNRLVSLPNGRKVSRRASSQSSPALRKVSS